MKKFKIYIIQVFTLMFIFSGCDKDILDLEPRDQFSIDVALTSLDNLEGSILAVYGDGRNIYSSNDICLYRTYYTDIVKAGTNIVDQQVWNQMMTFAGFDAANTGIRDIWNAYYQGLNRANIIISKIDNVEYNKDNPVAVQRRNTVLGEAYYFRAYYHLNLVEYWDNIVLADKVFGDPNENFKLASKSDVYDLIVSDLTTAIGLLPDASTLTSRGRVSKGVARHLLSLAYLDLGNWTGAAETAELVIADPAYGFAPIHDVFSEAAQENIEIIFSWQFATGNNNNVQRCSMQLTPLYDRCNGVSRTFEQGGRPWSRMSPTDYYWSLFEKDDLRLEAWHKLYWIYDVNTTDDPLPPGVSIGDTVKEDNIDDIIGLGMIVVEPTTTKYWEGDLLGRSIDDAQGFKNIILFRYPEALLVAAEGYMRSGTNLARGAELLNMIRARAGQDPIALNESNLLDEQAREFGFEGRRYPMLKRLGIVLERVNMGSPEIGANMLPHHIRWPIPKSSIDLSNLPQNQGYE